MFLRASFDDSGTHDNSDIVVWGGVFGEIEHFNSLERAWAEFLASPVEDERSITKWSSADCFWGIGEFRGWEKAARDRARRNARQCIIDSYVVPISFAVPVKPWQRIVAPVAPPKFNSANFAAFAKCGDAAIRVAKRQGKAIACVYDLGQRNQLFDQVVALHEERASEAGVPISQTFLAVADNYGLQAADCVATETYWVAVPFLKSGKIELDAQQQAFFGALSPISLFMSEDEMRSFAERWTGSGN